MNYTTFTIFPLEIKGVTERSNDKITAFKNYVLEKISYSGNVSDLANILPYFVFFHFLEDLMTDVSVNTGETAIIRTESNFESIKMVNAWNEGAKMLSELVEDNGESCNKNYTSKRSML